MGHDMTPDELRHAWEPDRSLCEAAMFASAGAWDRQVAELVAANNKVVELSRRLEVAENRSQEHLNAHMQSFGALAKISAMTDLEGEVDDYGDVVASVDRLSKRLEEAEKPIDTSTWFYKNCKRQRRNAAKVCQVCPFRASIEAQEAAIAGEEKP